MNGINNLDPKDPSDEVDYHVNWTRYLTRVGDTILSSSWPVVPSGITRLTDTHDDTRATIWLAGGTDGNDYLLTNRIVTVGSRIREKSIMVRVREQ
jgi:hypothetical protein